MEKRRCLEVSSWTGGDSGRDGAAPVGMTACLLSGGQSLGGVTGGAGTCGPMVSHAGAGRSESEGNGGCFAAEEGPGTCRRMSDSLAMTPRRRRRNGIVAAGDHHRRRSETNMAARLNTRSDLSSLSSSSLQEHPSAGGLTASPAAVDDFRNRRSLMLQVRAESVRR
jgi:hypothetical protein